MPSYNLTEVISHYQRKIERHPSEADVLRHSLAKLAKLDGVSISVLQETGIGRVVNALKKSLDDDVARKAKDLVARWKEIVANEEEEEEKEEEKKALSEEDGDGKEGRESEMEELEEPPKKKERRSHKEHHSRKKSSKHHHKDERLERNKWHKKGVEEHERRKGEKERKRSKAEKAEETSKSLNRDKRQSNERKNSKSTSKKSAPDPAKPSAFDIALNSDTDLTWSKSSSSGKPPSSSSSCPHNGQHHKLQAPSSSSLAVPEGISPHYKPLPPRKDTDLDGAVAKRLVNQSQDEALSALIAKSKTVRRTAVYSGTKRSGYYGEVPSLFNLCVHVLQEHVDSIEECGNLSFDVLEPILDRAAPQSLMRIEEFNPYLMEDTGALWERFCRKNFPKAEREEMESWREMFERCTVERENKLDLLKVKVKDSYVREKTGAKKAKLAYVGLNAKPPRNVMRAQAKNGTGIAVGQPLGRVSRPGATILAGPSGQTMRKPKVAPMMAKTLKMARGIKSGFRR